MLRFKIGRGTGREHIMNGSHIRNGSPLADVFQLRLDLDGAVERLHVLGQQYSLKPVYALTSVHGW